MLFLELRAYVPSENEVWQECWQAQLKSERATKLISRMSLDGGSTLVLDKLLSWGVIDETEKIFLTSQTNPLEKNRHFFKTLGKKSKEKARKAIEAFRPGQDVYADILEGMLNQALAEMNSKLVKKIFI
jgi:hypothetical protein